MTQPWHGPFVFETQALAWLARGGGRWFRKYVDLFPVFVAAATVTEHVRGFALLAERHAETPRGEIIAVARDRYLEQIASGAVQVLPASRTEALVAAQLAVLVPFSPKPPHREGSFVESRPDRLARWRSQISIAAAALAAGMPLIHDSPHDFEPVRKLVEQFPARFPGIAPPRFIAARKLPV